MPIPEEMYGTYYTSFDSQYVVFYITEDEVISVTSCGFNLVYDEKEYVSAIYCNAALAQEICYNSHYDGCDAIILYESEESAVVLWIIETEPAYEFILNSSNTNVTTEPFDFEEDMGDLKNYMSTYAYDDYTFVSIYEDGTAWFCSEGEDDMWSYALVNSSWCENWLSYSPSAEQALILYQEGYPNYYIFEILNEYELLLNGSYVFTVIS